MKSVAIEEYSTSFRIPTIIFIINLPDDQEFIFLQIHCHSRETDFIIDDFSFTFVNFAFF